MGVCLAFSVGPLNQFYIAQSSAIYFVLTIVLIFISGLINKSLIYITATTIPALVMFIRMKYITPCWKGKYDSLLDIGTVFLSNGEYHQALHYLKNAIKDNPAGHDALCALGLCYANLKKTDKSILYINKASELGSEAAKEYLKNNSFTSR
ncbi:tetratricopeptide repeat protein [Solidesulfovibrio sp.]|uniref:tetratricopeptide repeat protein n=1 Tax=Solidesulfovibrio sp. TaxID=2910990 RepID=UPI00263109C3|nr:tetratricopeptide repeat protein [Solidesulfovibrio sp.]